MYDNEGNKWKETRYDGYGNFGGQDYYDLVATMNGYDADRQKGIDLAFGKLKTKDKKRKTLFPALVTDPRYNWKRHDFTEEADGDPNQSWYQEEEEDYYESVDESTARNVLKDANSVLILAAGTSYYAGLTAKYWLEDLAGTPCQVEVASEYRYRNAAVPEGTLFVTISQSGETADTLAALRKAKESGYLGFVAICNVANSSLVRESDISLMTMAGPEIGVASTKAFTTQLVALQLLTLSLGRHTGLDASVEKQMIENLHELPGLCERVLALDPVIEKVSEAFANKHHALFLGRGEQYPIALEGALKLKEISYIHAEAYPSGELKHGPLALVDEDMPVVTVAPNNELLDKLKSNLHEVRARGGELFVFADCKASFKSEPGITVIDMPPIPKSLEAIVYTLPLQLLSYHVAVLKGTDVDQPRNLAKSVTVE